MCGPLDQHKIMLLILLSICCMNSIVNAEDSTILDVDDNTRSHYYEMEFLQSYEKCVVVLPTSNRHLLGAIHWSDLPDRELTDKEKRIVGTLYYNNGKRTSFGFTPYYIKDFYEEYGRFPVDGIEMLAMWNDDWIGKEGIAAFDELTTTDQMIKAYRSINPATGKFIHSYTTDQWEPFGICVSALPKDEQYKETPGLVYNEQTKQYEFGTVVTKMYHLTIYGEKEGSILIDKDFGTVVDSRQPFGNSGCGCRKKKG